MKTRFFLLLSACLSCLLAGCAGGFRSRPYVEAKDNLYVAPPAVAPAIDSLLAPLGWDSGKFGLELRKELRFQLNRKGVATPDDSAGAKASLAISVIDYTAGTCYGRARLTTSDGTREIRFDKKRKGAEDQRDPTVDDIRMIASALAEEARVDPRHRKNRSEPFTGMMILIN